MLELLKPVTWFPPMWAFACGAVSSGAPLSERWLYVFLGIVLAGPIVCGTSQAVNDWFDRHVDAINEPDRVIPSGRLPGKWGLWIACLGTALGAFVGALLGPWVFAATLVGLALAWAYSADPIRLKRDGWVGPLACGLAYEGLPWFAAAAAATGALPNPEIIAVAGLYALGAFGIMTLNDFKSERGDSLHGLASLPVRYGADRAARIACGVMLAAQLVVIALLFAWGTPWHGAVVAALVLGQLACMRVLLSDPEGRAAWFNARGTGLYVLGMMVAAFALRAGGGA